MLVAFLIAATADRESNTDATTSARLIGTRRLAIDAPLARVALTGFEFAEFGPGLLVRTVIEIAEGASSDTLDVVDLYAGAVYDQHLGAAAHHCVRPARARASRIAALTVAESAQTPLLWRAVTSHPYSGCTAELTSLDASLGATMLGGATVHVVTTVSGATQRRVGIVVDQGVARAVPRAGREAARWPDPLVLGPVRVTEMTRACAVDQLRFERDGHRCQVVIPRYDVPLAGCELGPSPLDPLAPQPLWLRPHAGMILDGSVPTEPMHLVFARGATLWEATLPLGCHRSEHRAPVVRWQAEAPSAVAVSPTGTRVLTTTGDDLWLSSPSRRAPMLLNPPGGALPRRDVRAAVFVSEDRIAAVFSSELITFDVSLPPHDAELSGDVRVDAAELTRGLRRMRATP
jgi:hypothetical protein